MWNVGNSLKAWYSFNEATNKNYGSLTAASLSQLRDKGSADGVTSYLGDSYDRVEIDNLNTVLTNTFTIAFSYLYPTNSLNDYEIIKSTNDTTHGFTIKKNQPDANTDQLALLIYGGGVYQGANVMSYPNLNETQWARFAISFDIPNHKLRWFVNGTYLGEQTISNNYVFQPDSFLLFNYKSSRIYYDEIVVLNKFVTQAEGESLSKLINTNNDLDLNNYDMNTTFQGMVVDQNGNFDKTETRTIHALQQPSFNSSCYSYDKTYRKHYYICQPQQVNTTAQNIDVNYQYSFDNTNWTTATTLYKDYSNQTFEVIGDSMSNDQSDWLGAFETDMNITSVNLPTLAVAGKTCHEILTQQLPNVPLNTDNLFITCGINGFITADNRVEWQAIYDGAKARGVKKIYMTTMPPYNYINTDLDQVTATTWCNKMKTENQWLKDNLGTKSDVVVSDVWTEFHDPNLSGSLKTDCGWKTSPKYYIDMAGDTGVHPNTAGAQYWADQQWKNGFDEMKQDTKYISLDIPRLIAGQTLYVKATPSYGGVTGDTNTFSPLSIPAVTTQQDCTSEGYYWYGGVCNTIPQDPSKAITAFTIPNQVGDTNINETTHTISVTMPYGISLTSLAPIITISGASVSPSSGATQDFTSAITYTVTAADSTTQAYTVTVTNVPNSVKPVAVINRGRAPINIIPKPTQPTAATQISTQLGVPAIPPIQKIIKNLKLGASNKETKNLQLFLISQDKGQSAKALSKNGVTNNFGELTRSALMEWQKANGLKPDGIFGPKTRAKIKELNL